MILKIFHSRIFDTSIWGVFSALFAWNLFDTLSEQFQTRNFSILSDYQFYLYLILFLGFLYFFLISFINNFGWVYKAKNAYENGDIDLAIKYYSILIKIFRWSRHYLASRGNCFYKLHKWQLAINDYTKALKYKPKASYIYENRANAYKMIGFKKFSANDSEKAKMLNKKI